MIWSSLIAKRGFPRGISLSLSRQLHVSPFIQLSLPRNTTTNVRVYPRQDYRYSSTMSSRALELFYSQIDGTEPPSSPLTQNDEKAVLGLDDLYQNKTTAFSDSNSNSSSSHYSSPRRENSQGKTIDDILLQRQYELEGIMQREATEKYLKMSEQLEKLGRSTGQNHVRQTLLQWYEPLRLSIQEEIDAIHKGLPGKDRSNYGPFLLMLRPEKLAVIILDSTVNKMLRAGPNGIFYTELAMLIGQLMEAEINAEKLKVGSERWKIDVMNRAMKNCSGNLGQFLRRLRFLVGDGEWTQTATAKMGSTAVTLLLKSAFIERDVTRPAFLYTMSASKNISGAVKKVSRITMAPEVYTALSTAALIENNSLLVVPQYLPMLVRPRRWDNKSRKTSCYYSLRCKMIRTASNDQHVAVSLANIDKMIDVLDYIGSVPWKINKKVLTAVEACWEKDLRIGELPAKKNFPLPSEAEAIRIPKRPVIHAKTDEYMRQKITATLDQYPVDHPYWSTPSFDAKYHSEMVALVARKNADLHSLRCDMKIKLWTANKFIDDVFYYPFSLDFRGRAYPVPPNLNHLGSDLCRALLIFAEPKPLGPNGLDWLKLHLANLCGKNKTGKRARIDWVNSKMPQIIAAATNPLGDDKLSKWWQEQEEPFQALATCIEIHQAISSGDPASYMCHLPVHQDGSCNGLQHYAALGRDAAGGAAVNLTPSDTPQDVYSKVLEIVLRRLDQDAAIPKDDENPVTRGRGEKARELIGLVDRKVIKQTVMTSVYGVTARGASIQVANRLKEKMLTGNEFSVDKEKHIQQLGGYVANLALSSLTDLFTSAEVIMRWLGTIASIVAVQGQTMAWITPLGLPVMQPYRKENFHAIRTITQTLTLQVDDDALPVSPRKQKTAFPPNFVHSLDATHMMMTALRMQQLNLQFAAVHDSYWTHACDVDIMSEQLRKCFVELYEQPILESLLDSLEVRFPDAKFPRVPKRGNLDLNKVLESTYFFH